MASAASMKDRQKETLKKMIELQFGDGSELAEEKKAGAAGGAGWQGTWKLLIYDQYCQDIISPLFTVSELRQMGVTMHMLITRPRDRVPDVSAVYFVRPTQENIDLIAQDAARQLYDAFYLNFSSSVPRALLERLAQKNIANNSSAKIVRVYDQYSEFISVDSSLISLQHTNSYVALNDPSQADAKLMAYIDSVVDALFSLVVTGLGVVPVIRCRPGEAAELAASKLHARLRDHLVGRNTLFNSASAHSFHRPVLVLVDRNIDLSIAAAHAWHYAALAHDLLDMQLLRVKVKVDDEEGKNKAGAAGGAAPARKKKVEEKVYDLSDPADTFWRANSGLAFPLVAQAVQDLVKTYQDKMSEVNRRTGVNQADLLQQIDGLDRTDGLQTVIAQLPELRVMKRLLDEHTTIATALLQHVKERELDVYFALEEELIAGAGARGSIMAPADKKKIAEMLAAGGKGSIMDKLRLAMVYYLCAELQEQELKDVIERLEQSYNAAAAQAANGGNAAPASAAPMQATGSAQAAAFQSYVAPLLFLKKWRFVNRIGDMSAAPAAAPKPAGAAPAAGGYFGAIAGNLAGRIIDSTVGVVAGVSKLLPLSNKDLPLTRVVDALAANRDTAETEKYLYFDPKMTKIKSSLPTKTGRLTTPFKDVIVFVLGGASYSEQLNLVEWAKKSSTPQQQKSVVYGGTELVSPTAFVAQLGMLGKNEPLPAAAASASARKNDVAVD